MAVWPFICTFIFVGLLGFNLAVGFTPFTLACVVFCGIMTAVSWVTFFMDSH